MKELIVSPNSYWLDEELLGCSVEQAFDIEYWRGEGKVLGSAQGRGTTWFVRGSQCDMALRHYRRGGLFGKLVADSYWFAGWHKTRSYLEFQTLKLLANGGVNVPRPIAARVEKSGLCYRADILVEKIAEAKDLVALLKVAPLPLSSWVAIGAMIRKMHDLQVNHTDLNAHNILIDLQQRVWLIDFDKCGRQQGEEWKQGNLGRLKRSFVKEVLREDIHWQQEHWQWLCNGYYSAQP